MTTKRMMQASYKLSTRNPLEKSYAGRQTFSTKPASNTAAQRMARKMSYGGSYGPGSYGPGSYGPGGYIPGGGSYLGGPAFSGDPTEVSFQQAETIADQSNGTPIPLYDQNGNIDSYVYGSNSTGTPPDGPQVTTASGNLTITATDNAGFTQAGGVYGHSLTFSEPGSNNLATITAASSAGLLVANPVVGNPSVLQINEYKGY